MYDIIIIMTNVTIQRQYSHKHRSYSFTHIAPYHRGTNPAIVPLASLPSFSLCMSLYLEPISRI